MTGFRSGWNLPPGCTDRDIDEAAGAFLIFLGLFSR
jgi:hypothetical protein